MSIEMVLVG